MPKANVKFKQTDISRALRAIGKSGIPMTLEITPDGAIRLIPVSSDTVKKQTEKPKTLF